MATDPAAMADGECEARVRDSFGRQTIMRTFGASLTRVAPGEVDIEAPIDPALTQQHGFMHAGAVATLLDSACGYAAFSLMPAGSGILSIEFKVNLLAPAAGERLAACGRVVRAGRTITVCAADAWAVTGSQRTRVALMQATMICLEGRRGVEG